MDPIIFLRSKGILHGDATELMITFKDGTRVDLVQLFDEYHSFKLQYERNR